MSRKTAVENTREHIAPGGAWHGDAANTAKARWFLKRAKKRAARRKLERASRKRNR